MSGGRHYRSSYVSSVLLTYSALVHSELRHELERTRSFYRGKIDQMELAYAAKVRALKRGDSGTAGGREAGADLPQGISKPSTGRVEGGWSAAAGSEDVVGGSAASQADLNAPRGVYEERINQLQRLLVESREELGRTKAELHVLKESTAVASQSPQGGFAPPLPPDSSRQVVAQVSEQQAAEVQRARDKQRDAEAALAAKEGFWSQCQRHLEERHSAEISGLTQRWAAERDQLNGFLREESAKCDALRTELSNRAAQAHPPRSVDAISVRYFNMFAFYACLMSASPRRAAAGAQGVGAGRAHAAARGGLHAGSRRKPRHRQAGAGETAVPAPTGEAPARHYCCSVSDRARASGDARERGPAGQRAETTV